MSRDGDEGGDEDSTLLRPGPKPGAEEDMGGGELLRPEPRPDSGGDEGRKVVVAMRDAGDERRGACQGIVDADR